MRKTLTPSLTHARTCTFARARTHTYMQTYIHACMYTIPSIEFLFAEKNAIFHLINKHNHCYVLIICFHHVFVLSSWIKCNKVYVLVDDDAVAIFTRGSVEPQRNNCGLVFQEVEVSSDIQSRLVYHTVLSNKNIFLVKHPRGIVCLSSSQPLQQLNITHSVWQLGLQRCNLSLMFPVLTTIK